MKKIAIYGVVGKPASRLTSHNAGWNLVYKNMLETKYETKVDIQPENLEEYDEVWINEGVNFSPGTWNIFGGVGEALINRIKVLNSYEGPIYCWGHGVPEYSDLITKRKIAGVEFNKNITEVEHILDSTELIFGDSHSISIYKPGCHISRNDGKTLFGALKVGLNTFIDDTKYDKVTIYLGNIDIRFHICRLNVDIKELVKEFKRQCDLLNCEVTVQVPLPIENESRKLPGTGLYNKEKFFGSWNERNAARIELSKELINAFGPLNVQRWPVSLLNENKELDFGSMEARQSVHLAPKSYKFIKELQP